MIKFQKHFVVDIETMKNPDMVQFLPEPKADPRLKDPLKIEVDLQKKRQAQIDKMALNPLFSTIACIGIVGTNGTKKVLFGNEQEMIKELLSLVGGSHVITFNGKGFDFDFIYKRGAITGAVPLWKKKQYTDRYKAVMHTDLMLEWDDRNFTSLNTLSRVILGKEKVEFDVMTIPELIKTEEGKKQLEEYCIKDCELTMELAERLGYIKEDLDV